MTTEEQIALAYYLDNDEHIEPYYELEPPDERIMVYVFPDGTADICICERNEYKQFLIGYDANNRFCCDPVK